MKHRIWVGADDPDLRRLQRTNQYEYIVKLGENVLDSSVGLGLDQKNIKLLTRALELNMPWQVLDILRSIDHSKEEDWTLAKDTMSFLPFLSLQENRYQ